MRRSASWLSRRLWLLLPVLTWCVAALAHAAVPPVGGDYLAWKRAKLGLRAPPSGKDVFIANACVRLGVGFEGAWGLGTTGGDPADPEDDNLELMFSLTGTSNSLAVRIDGILHVLDGSSPEIVRADDGTYITATWTVDGLLLRARYELTDRGSGRADTAKVTYTITNPTPKVAAGDRAVSLKLGLDIDIGNAYARLVTPGGIVAVETGFGQTGSGGAYPLAVPDFWQGCQRDSLADPGLVGQGTFAGAGATPPDKVVIGSWSAVCAGTAFDAVPSGASYGDGAVALWWLNRSLPPGGSASFVVLYGLAQMSRGGTGVAVAVSAPASLGPANSPFAPNPFSVMVQVQNLGAEEVLNLPVSITLPSGLAVAAGGSASQSIAALASGATGLLTFRVAASPEYAGQTLSYTVVAGTGESQVTLDRTLQLPATPPITVTFLAGAGGSVSGLTTQQVLSGGSTAPVTALPAQWYVFEHWNDGSAANPRTLTDVTVDQTFTAQFRAAGQVLPDGEFSARVDAPERGLWDLSGVYTLSVAGNPWVLDLIHDTSGKLMGTAVYTVGSAAAVSLPIRGNVRDSVGHLVVKIVLQGKDPAGISRVALALNLTLDAATRELAGALTGSVWSAAAATPVADSVRLPVPAPMDGTWALRLRLVPAGRVVTGTALLTLANGAEYAWLVRGRAVGSSVVLSLAGVPVEPLARGLAMRATVTTLEGHWLVLQTFSCRGYGQTLAW